MPTTRKRSITLESSALPTHHNNGETQSSGYEESREKRIKENLERMQKLGIFDLSLKLKSCNAVKKNKRNYSVRNTPNGKSPLQPLGPTRRSSRLQNVTPVSYVEVHKEKKELQNDGICLEEGVRPEIYTEKHENLLGDCTTDWALFVDGYGKDGKRIYDSYTGKTCHQCRQKTLGHRTHCSQCNMIQGQFCGDCLFTRYGENVLEANQNPDWICPVCRGICNCSLCRKAKGWAPTGYLYRKVASLGFKSVAHYLIKTHRQTQENLSTKTPLSAKRSLPFLDTETQLADVNDDQLGVSKGNEEFKVGDNTEVPEEYHDTEVVTEETFTVNILAGVSVSEKDNDEHLEFSKPQSKEEEINEINVEEVLPLILYKGDINIEQGSCSKKQKRTFAPEPSPDYIGGRLRQRRMEKSIEGKELAVFHEETKKNLDIVLTESGTCLDSIGGRLRCRRKITSSVAVPIF